MIVDVAAIVIAIAIAAAVVVAKMRDEKVRKRSFWQYGIRGEGAGKKAVIDLKFT